MTEVDAAGARQPLADQLLAAQVEWVLTDLTDRFGMLAATAVDDLLAAAATITVEELVPREAVRVVAVRLLVEVGGSSVVEDLVGVLAEAVHDLPASDEHQLGDVVDRDAVEALVVKILSLHQLQDRVMDRLTQSPSVGIVASRFVTRIVADLVEQNRARAEKIPGMASVLAMGTSAASRVRSATDQWVGDAAGKGAQFALRRTNGVTRELIRDAPLREAAMELWDLQAAEPVAALREYLTAQDVRDVAVLVHRIVVGARGTAWAGALVGAIVDVFFDRYGEWDVATLLAEAGLERDALIADVVAIAGPALVRLRADGTLADMVRARLAPFWGSPEVAALLPG